METCWTRTQDFTQCSTPEQLAQYGGDEVPLGKAPEAGEAAVTATLVNTYTIAARSRTGGEFAITRAADGSLHRTCTPAGTDGCGPAGRW